MWVHALRYHRGSLPDFAELRLEKTWADHSPVHLKIHAPQTRARPHVTDAVYTCVPTDTYLLDRHLRQWKKTREKARGKEGEREREREERRTARKGEE